MTATVRGRNHPPVYKVYEIPMSVWMTWHKARRLTATITKIERAKQQFGSPELSVL